MGRLRICQLITELQPAGAERVVYELACRLDRSRFEVEVAALRGGEVAAWLAKAGIPVTIMDVRSKLDLPRLARLVDFLRQGRFDILHTHLFHADFAGRLAGRRAHVPHLVHSVHVAEARFRPWRYAWAHATANWCDRIVCVSQSVLEHHARKSRLDASRYQVIYNGIDTHTYVMDPRQRLELRRQWGVTDEQKVLLFVGRLNVQKNVQLFLETAENLHQRMPIMGVLAGDGPERDIVRRFLAKGDAQKWLRWLGHVSDVPALLSAGDMLIQPSRWEGFGLSAAEAMAVGLPVVATQVPGLSEVIEDGVSGLLVDSEDLPAMVAAVERVIQDPALAQRLAQNGQARVQEHFSIERNIAQHEGMYLEIAGRADSTLTA